MPQVDTQGAKTGGRRKRLKRPAKSTAPPKTPDTIDRERQPRTPPAPVKTRQYAHPYRPGPQKAMHEGEQARQGAARRRVKLRAEVRQIHVTPVASPDARDSLRSPAQRAHDADVVANTVKASRVKYLRKAGKGAGVRAVKAELEGHGQLAKVLNKVGEHAVKSTGNPTLSRATSLSIDENIGSRALKDVISVPAQAIPSVYEPLAGSVEALRGDSTRLKKVGTAIDKNDFVYNVGAAVVEAAGGDTKAAKRRVAQAKASANEHPGYAALEVAGVKGTLARGAGRVMRSGVTGKTLKRVASTERDSKVLEGTNITVPRSWSGDVITKAAQVNRARSRTFHPEGDRVTSHDLERRVDERVSITGTDLGPFVREFAHTSTTGTGKVKLMAPGRAATAAADLEALNGHAFVPVKVEGTGRVALVPKVALDRFQEHAGMGHKTTLGQAMEVAQDAFRRTVLTTSTSWALGNLTEGAARSALVKAGPRSYYTGHKLIKRVKALDPAKAEELVQRVADGGHYSLSERLQVQDVAGKFAGTSVEPLANALHTFLKTPGPKQAAQAWKVWTTGVQVGMRGLEKQFQVAMLGAEVRRSPLMSDHLVKLSHAAIDEAAKGLKNTENQVRFARAVQTAYGKYSAFSPSTRMLLATYSPFLPWFLNAVHLVAWTMPREHPTVTGLTAAAVNATEDTRKESGLDLSSDLPGWLQGSIATKGGLVRAGRFTPAGVAADLPGTLAGQVLPLYSGPILALKGMTFGGSRIKGDTEGQRQWNSVVAAMGEWIDSTIPVVAQAKRIHDKGAQALNPLAPTKPSTKKKTIRRAPSGAWDPAGAGGAYDPTWSGQ